ncbi:MAG: hypothetical protein ACYC3I_24050 [Gemmataceae bacterium]
MATPERYQEMTTAVLKKAAAILTTTGFFAAAIFLAAILWMPANAAPSSTTLHVQPSMLLAFDKPQPPAPKLHLPDLPSLTDEDAAKTDLASVDLATELNSWTYTQSNNIDTLYVVYVYLKLKFIPLFNEYAALQYAQAASLRSFLLSFNNPVFTPAIDYLGFAHNVLSPYK